MIQTVEKQYNRDNKSFIYKITRTDNKVMFVPHDTANTDYQEILEWVANGGTIVDNGA